MAERKLFILLTVLVLMFSLCAGAAAETIPAGNEARVVTWKLTAPEINTDELVALTFGITPEEVQSQNSGKSIVKENRDPGYAWSLKGVEGGPYCDAGPMSSDSTGIQTRFYSRPTYFDSPYSYQFNLDSWNTFREESGFDAPRAAETVQAAAEILERLGLNRESWKAEPVFFTTLGRMAGTTRSRKVFFEETLEGLPVRWSDDSLDGDSHIIAPADKCCAVLVFSDEEGLLQISGNWCSFEPLSRADHLLSAEEIVSLFVKAGCRNPEPEACWFLHRDGNAATATLAWRVENSYLNAVDGSWLQTGK